LTLGQSAEPNPKRCHIIRAHDLQASVDALIKAERIPPGWPTWENTNQPRLLAAQEWLDWEWVRAHHPTGKALPERHVAWWAKVYSANCAIRTIERFKELLRFHARELAGVVWKNHMSVVQALDVTKLCPDRKRQRTLVERFGIEELAERYHMGCLPIDRLLMKRVAYGIGQLEDPTDEDMATAITTALEEWKIQRKLDPPAHPRPPSRPRRRGRYAPGTAQKA